MPYLLFAQNENLNYIELESNFMLTMGCTPDCNVILPPDSMSHFRVFTDSENRWLVENLGLEPENPQRIIPLANGDQIALNRVTITFLNSVDGLGAAPFAGTISLSAGQKIGKYTVSNLLNRTGMSCLYLVHDEKEKPFAAKVFSKPLVQAEADGFYDQIQQIRFTDLPGIAPYHAYGTFHRNTYYVTDYYEHPDLAFRISGKAPMVQSEALGITRALAGILRNAYLATGLFHGALSPSNVLYDNEERMMIAEFGTFIWRSLVLNGGRAAASPWYISPEAVSGGEISFRTDMYSLGVMLFQMLTGVLPFHSPDPAELLSMHLERPFPLPSERNPNVTVSSGTLQLLLRMTAREPASRFENWDQLLEAVSYAETSRQLENRPPISYSSVQAGSSTMKLKSSLSNIKKQVKKC